MVRSGKNWSLCKLGAICDFIGGSQPPKDDFIYEPKNDYIRLIQIRDYKSDKHLTFIPRASAKRFCSKEDVMIGRYGPPLFQILRGIEGAYNVALIKAMPKSPEIIDKDFLFFRLQDSTLRNFIITVSERTVGQDGVRKDLLEDYEIFLPPINEQRRIVAKLEVLLGKVDACQKRLEKIPRILKRFRQAVLAAACDGRLTADWREKNNANLSNYEKPEELQSQKIDLKTYNPNIDLSSLPELLEGWEYTSIDSFLSNQRKGLKTGPFGSMLHKSDHQAEGIAVLGIENIGFMQFIPGSKIHITSQKANELSEYDALPGDILISRSGTVGEVCVVPKGLGEARISTNLIRVIVLEQIMLPSFFCYLFNGSPFVLTQVRDLCKGSTRDFLNQTILKSILFPLPPLSEQQEIVRRVESLFKLADQLEARYQKAKAYVDKLTQSILAKAFRGELVPQDPNDEPASVLLERIQKEKSLGENVRTTKARKPNVKVKPADKEVLENERPVSEINEISIKKVEEDKIAQSVDNALVEVEKLGEQLCLPFVGAED